MNRFSFWRNDHGWLGPTYIGPLLGGVTILYVLSYFFDTGLRSTLAFMLALLGLTGFFIWAGKLRKSALVWFFLASILIQLVNWGWAYLTMPPEWAESALYLDRLSRLFLFLPLAWVLAGSTRNTLLVWGLAGLAIVFIPWISGNGWSEIALGLQGQRVDFGLTNAQHTSMVYGVLLLGLVVFTPRITGIDRGNLSVIRVVTCGILIVIAALVVVITQTRAIWLALSITGCVGAVAGMIYLARNASWYVAAGSVAALLVVVTGGAVLFNYWMGDMLVQRVTREQGAWAQLLAGDFRNMPNSSIGIRVQMWAAAIDWIQQRPLMGWGRNGAHLAIEHSEWLPQVLRERFNHVHNSYLEVQVRYGLLGTLLFAALVGWFARQLAAAKKNNRIPKDIYVFAWLFFLFWIIANAFEGYMFKSIGVYIFNIVAAGIVTHIWAANHVGETPASARS